MRGKRYELPVPIAAIVFFLIVTGCASLLRASANYGQIVPNADVTQSFERFEINPNFNYFISGSEPYPNALIALDKTYTLEPTLWKKVEFTPQTFRTLITDMQNKAILGGEIQIGFSILDGNRRAIGAWYSLRDFPTWVKMAGDKTVVIPPPDSSTYERRERVRIKAPTAH